MKKPTAVLAAVLCLWCLPLQAQEFITPLKGNSRLFNHKEPPRIIKRSGHGHDTLPLPFFDDFSYESPRPDPRMWLDKYVYINSTYSTQPPSWGIATFDGLNQFGRAYQREGIIYGPCDTLTSAPIDLGGLSNADSVYLSFFLQPQGLGDDPEPEDSFIVQLRYEGAHLDTWFHAFSAPGGPLQPFRQYTIPILNVGDSNFFYKGFQFRFINFGNRSGNFDHWHLDYVRLDRDRHQGDTIYDDVASYRQPRSILRRYTAMPLTHFNISLTANLVSQFDIFGSNLSDVTKNVRVGIEIFNAVSGEQVHSEFRTEGFNLFPFEYHTFDNNILGFFNSNLGGDSGALQVKTAIITNDAFSRNDTASLYVNLTDYFAYDDGTAEGGYGILGSLNSKIAVEFDALRSDTLRGVLIHFNEGRHETADKIFHIVVWKELSPLNQNATQDVELYRQEFVRPQWVDSTNGFYYYKFDDPVPVSGRFYIGTHQPEDFHMELGWDKNYSLFYNNRENRYLYYNLHNIWRSTALRGTPMIRPVVGREMRPVSVRPRQEPSRVTVYPNPATDVVHISTDPGNKQFELFDLNGRRVATMTNSDGVAAMSVAHLPTGLYTLLMIDTVRHTRNYSKIVVKR